MYSWDKILHTILEVNGMHILNREGDISQDPKIANTILDRVLHYASVINIVGDSHCLKNHFQSEEKSKVDMLK